MSNIRVFLGKSLKASVAVKRLLASYAYGIFRLIFSFFDSYTVSDSPAKTIQKPRQDEFSVSDLTEKALSKPVSDQFSASEDYVIAFTKAAEDSGDFTETLNFDIHLVKSESIGITDDVDGEASALDDQTIQFIKVRQETASASDVLLRFAGYNRSFTDAGSSADEKVLAFGKSLSDASSVSELFLFQTGKGLTDQSFVVDSHVFNVSKQLADSHFVADQPAINLTKAPISDSLASADDVSLQPLKSLSEQVIPSDVIFAITYGKSLSDTSAISEDQSFSVSMPKAEDVYMIDQPAKVLQKSIADSASAADLFDYFVQAGIFTTSTGSTTESISVNFSKPLGEAFSAQELIALTLNRFVIDNGSAVDQQVKSLSKGLADQTTSSDSGSLRGQGYCDFDYFSEDYVGYSRIFT